MTLLEKYCCYGESKAVYVVFDSIVRTTLGGHGTVAAILVMEMELVLDAKIVSGLVI